MHLAHIGCPVLCDKMYGGHAKITRGELRRQTTSRKEQEVESQVILTRQALHARRIKLAHPASGKPIEFTAPLPNDLTAVLDELRAQATEAMNRRRQG